MTICVRNEWHLSDIYSHCFQTLNLSKSIQNSAYSLLVICHADLFSLLKKIIRIDIFLTCRIKLQEVMIRMAYRSGSGPTSFLTASHSDVCLWLCLWLTVDAVGQFGVSRKEDQWLLKLPSGWHPTPSNTPFIALKTYSMQAYVNHFSHLNLLYKDRNIYEALYFLKTGSLWHITATFSSLVIVFFFFSVLLVFRSLR